jgi:hypothetical protein
VRRLLLDGLGEGYCEKDENSYGYNRIETMFQGVFLSVPFCDLRLRLSTSVGATMRDLVPSEYLAEGDCPARIPS